jgi:signal transduction histidine kinase
MIRRRSRPGGPDSRMLRAVRLRLIAWSAGSTLVVLVVLGAALYAAVAQTLVSQSTQTLENRIEQMRAKVVEEANDQTSTSGAHASKPPGPSETPEPTKPATTPTDDPGATPAAGPSAAPNSSDPNAANEAVSLTTDASQPGYVIGGPSSGTLAFALDPDAKFAIKLVPPSTAGGSSTLDVPEPADSLKEAARKGRTVVWEGDLHGTPVRFVLEAVPTSIGPIFIESIGDRTSEIALLRALLLVLLVGSLAVLVAAVGFGYFYAGRALVPIRRSLQRQRDFAADASHELRTPLAIVRGAVHELRATDGAADGAAEASKDRKRSIADIEAGTDRLGRLVDDLLLLARADSGAIELRREPVDLADIATDSVARFTRQAAERSVRLRLDVAPAQVIGDPDRLAQVVAILVDNAVKHSPEGGTVGVVVREGSTLVVEDEGPGIRPEDLPHIFDRFWRAPDAPAGGTGLGLAIASWVVESHGGGISATNRDGGGATFTVTLPGSR